MRIAIIPARGGSKRIPRKNIRIFAGKPMIGYAIDAARDSGLFQRIVVSTDDQEISKIARDFGAEVPFRRPSDLANDHTATVPVIRHAMVECENIGYEFETVCCIYPSVPLIQIADLHRGLQSLEQSDAKYSFPVAQFPVAIHRALHRSSDGKITAVFPDNELSRSQDMVSTYYDAGQFYWGSKRAWQTSDRIHSDGIGIVIPNWRAVDIDELSDWKRAEIIYNHLINEAWDE